MLIIQWLKRLPGSDGILIVRRTVTNCDTPDQVDHEAHAIWTDAASLGTARPDGFQVVAQDGRSICAARYGAEGGLSA